MGFGYIVSQEMCHFYFYDNFMEHSLILIIFVACNIMKKLDVDDCNFARLTLILLLRYFVKCVSRGLVVFIKFLNAKLMSKFRVAAKWCQM